MCVKWCHVHPPTHSPPHSHIQTHLHSQARMCTYTWKQILSSIFLVTAVSASYCFLKYSMHPLFFSFFSSSTVEITAMCNLFGSTPIFSLDHLSVVFVWRKGPHVPCQQEWVRIYRNIPHKTLHSGLSQTSFMIPICIQLSAQMICTHFEAWNFLLCDTRLHFQTEDEAFPPLLSCC